MRRGKLRGLSFRASDIDHWFAMTKGNFSQQRNGGPDGPDHGAAAAIHSGGVMRKLRCGMPWVRA